ncbi:SH3 domain-containing protein [Timonella senegalensis]|uniref:SH3 domain-containing protein n=1 Tax=Timonella senegalensis TaxID=1465825 RepID=UPI0028B0B88C|nr:SH3 domain-containing protein [Timonella senegalensis]
MKLLTVFLASALVAVGVVIGAPEQAQAAGTTSVSISASKTTVLKGQSSTLTTKYYKSGKLQKSGKLYLQYKNGTKWSTARTVSISSTGTTKSTVWPPKNRVYRFATTDMKVKSPSISVKLKSGFTNTVSSKVIKPGSSVTFKTSYFSAGVAKTGSVALQYKSGTKWKNYTTKTLKSGAASATVKPKNTREWRWRHTSSGKVSPTVKVSIQASTPSFTPVTYYVDSASTPLNMRSGAGTTYAVVEKLPHGTKVTTVSATTKSSGGYTWVNIKAPSGKTGWVVNKYLTKTNPVNVFTPQTFYVDSASSALNMRSGAGTTYAVVEKLPYGTKVTTISSVKKEVGGLTWVNIKAPSGKTGWVVNSYLSTTNPIGTFTPVTYYVTSEDSALNMRSDAGTTYAVVEKLPYGTKVTTISSVKKEVGGLTWVNIKAPSGKTGWVTTAYLSTTPPPVIPATRSFTFTGSGFGHGVGMPQYGAYQMAREGNSASKILSYYYTGTTVKTTTTPEVVSVKLTGASTSSGTTAGISAGKFRLRNSAGATIAKTDGLAAGNKVTFTVSNGLVKATVKNSAGTTITTATDSTIRMHWSGTTYYDPSGTDAVLSLTGAQGKYRHGRITVTVVGGKINVVNDLRLNTEYLYGLGEMPSSWGVSGNAALQAQAIAARSYVIGKGTTKSTSCNCNVVDTTTDQYFSGWTKENGAYGEYWVNAVNATKSSNTSAQVLYNGSAVVKSAHYYSYSGGRTANSQDVWTNGVTSGGVLSYEQSVADPYSAKAPGVPGTWTHVVSEAQLRKTFSSLSDIESVEIISRYESGQIKTLRAKSASGATQSVTRSDSGTSSVMGWRTILKGKNSKISSSSSSSSIPGTWITSITLNG